MVKNFDNIIVTIEYISDFEKSKQDDGGYKFDVVDWRGLPKGAIIFCQDIGGNAITFYKNAVWYVDHDPYRKTKVCDSFTDFLKMLK